MTRFRRARLAGALVALGMLCHPAFTGSPWSGCSFRCDPRTRRLRHPRKTPGQSVGSKMTSVAERQVRLDAGDIRVVHQDRFRHMALFLGALARKKVAAAAFGALDFAGPCDLESFGHGLAGFATGDWLWHGKSPVEYQMAEAMQPETGGIFCWVED